MPSGHTALTYNGVPQKDLVKRVPHFVKYVPQSDKHIATLTTNETLEYAHKFVGAGLAKKGAETPRGTIRPYSQPATAIQPAVAQRPYSPEAQFSHTADAVEDNGGGALFHLTTGQFGGLPSGTLLHKQEAYLLLARNQMNYI
ncbi:hypothetical protein PF005_g15373 [Phytophthora fragariae]|uniref:Uncharacterized protein n=1 Tax=Phytophthora fragariae TaxID=53985 RepID=A0A6A3XDY1_9STRA|nr:hypothetical protein PF003_g3944 [Phytophthora fragariae]KAE8934218.1 hypothetical protein PF009_g15803 [Phytophthora fragariae]KAE9018854.1 hypothetical protein PF011_g6093 [Phytophthora fragariae]KAE9083386.1 hypothetical protein PF007_g21918 [Phytophthora fragariae]KAE9100289.1 hypothetical protein PF010_g14865 [Phytophthora fragariae]